MADGAGAAWNLGDAEKLSGFGIKPHELVGIGSGFYEPESVSCVHCHSIGYEDLDLLYLPP